MPHDVMVVCRPEVGAGFALAGVPPVEVQGAAQGAEQVRTLLEQPGVGVVLVEDGIYDAMPAELVRLVGRRPMPMVVPFPAPEWGRRRDTAEAYIVELLRQVIGYRVRLR